MLILLHGLCPAALIRQPRFFCAQFIIGFHGLATRVISMPVYSFRKRKANAVCNTCSLQTKLELLLN